MHSTNLVPPRGAPQRVNFTSVGGTIYDKSGILLAGLATAGSKMSAEQKAKQDAIDRGAKVGDTVTYTYEEFAPVPGNWTMLSLDVGKGKVGAADIRYAQGRLLTKIDVWDMVPEKLRMSLDMGALVTSYGGDAGGMTWIGMPVGVDVGYSIASPLAVSGRLLIDPLLGGLGYALGGDGGWVEAGGRVDFRPFKLVGLFADGWARRTPQFLEEDPIIANELAVTGGFAFIFGDDD